MFLNKTLLLSVTLALFGASAVAGAAQYTNAINTSSWGASSSVFECRLTHDVPYFGQAVFSTRAGEASKFYLRSQSIRFDAGEAKVHSKSPVWHNSGDYTILDSVAVKQGRRPLWLGSKKAEKYLAELNRGREIEFVRPAWYEEEREADVQLSLSNIGFKKQYKKYLNCLSGLLPANFDQLERTALYYPVSAPEVDEGLSDKTMSTLDRILRLVKHDNSIKKFYIDGHASAPGDRADNLELSKRRAELVSNYLKERGIPEDWIVMRWHGERYPVASNASASGRAKNRRVTLRIERVEEIEVLPLASN